MSGRGETAAEIAGPVLGALIEGELAIEVRFWDSSTLGRANTGTSLVLSSPLALRHLLWAPNELGLGRAYVSGELDIEGDVYGVLALRQTLTRHATRARKLSLGERLRLLSAARRLGALGLRPPPPPEEARLRGPLHSKARDRAAIAHHYDISNDFYRVILGETMTYSCAYFAEDDYSLGEAQHAKYDLICAKLRLEPGMRLLDVGCGWGSMVMHAAEHYGVEAVGITISAEQAELARRRVAEAGLTARVEIRLQDYRDLEDGPYDAISSIGMYEHVGLSRLREYFEVLASLVPPGGVVLNHGISRPGTNPHGPGFGPNSFTDRYVFPDAELHEVGRVVSTMQAAGLEARDVENLREHYAKTLRAWVVNLETDWERAVELVGTNRARVWRLYMSMAAANFAANRTSIHQVLSVRTSPDGVSAMPATRRYLLGAGERSGRDAELTSRGTVAGA